MRRFCFKLAEEGLNLPAFSIDLRRGVVGTSSGGAQQHQDFLTFLNPHFDHDAARAFCRRWTAQEMIHL